MRLGCAVAGLAFLAWSSSADAQAERRQLGAHQHGHGSMNIAIDGQRVVIELDAPGADILGFEHAPKTAAEKAAADRALATLRDPLALFVPPTAARCRVESANVEIEQDEEPGQDKAQHNDFRAEYTLICAAPASLTSLTFAYFDKFRRADEVEVSLITTRAQRRFEATRSKRRIDFGRIN
jgi:hypothetical protein